MSFEECINGQVVRKVIQNNISSTDDSNSAGTAQSHLTHSHVNETDTVVDTVQTLNRTSRRICRFV